MWFYLMVIVFIIVLAILKTNTVKGIMGERSVGKVVKKIALQTGGLEMRDFMMRDARSSSQIDNMLLTQKALYVIEVKNYKGMIFGGPHQQNWTVTVKHVNKKRGRGGRVYKRTNISKHQFYNPLKQNQTHINKITNLTDIQDTIPIINVVVFCRRALVKVEGTMPSNTYVASINKLAKLIDQVESRTEYALSLTEQMTIVDTLYRLNITDKRERKAHVKNLKVKYTK